MAMAPRGRRGGGGRGLASKDQNHFSYKEDEDLLAHDHEKGSASKDQNPFPVKRIKIYYDHNPEKGKEIDHWSRTIMMPPSPPPWGSHGMIRQAK